MSHAYTTNYALADVTKGHPSLVTFTRHWQFHKSRGAAHFAISDAFHSAMAVTIIEPAIASPLIDYVKLRRLLLND